MCPALPAPATPSKQTCGPPLSSAFPCPPPPPLHITPCAPLPGSDVALVVQDKGEMVMRAYTPTSCDDDVGYFDLVVKVYFANNNPAFPLVSSCLWHMPSLHTYIVRGQRLNPTM